MARLRHHKEYLTHEWLRKEFANNFQLTRQAIELARFYIRSGHEINLREVLEEVQRHPQSDYVQELKAIEKEEANETE